MALPKCLPVGRTGVRSPAYPRVVNVLFVTLDQFRADSYGAAGHPLVNTPTLDRIAREGVRLARHYSQAAPCAPGRAALYTGTYQMNNRVVYNGSPLEDRFDNLARLCRRAGYDPTLFGYTDQGLDPLQAEGPDDPRLDDYDGILPGFSVGLYLPESQAPWVEWLRDQGFDVPYGWASALREESSRPAEYSLSGFLTTHFLAWLERQDSGWCAHLSYLRPHPPYAAAGEYSTRIDPADVSLPLAPSDQRHPLHEMALASDYARAPQAEEEIRHLRAQYYGMIDEIDVQLSRVVRAIESRGEWDDTLVVVTADHADQLGDHGLIEKLGYFPQSYHILGLWRDPRRADAGRVLTQPTENVDLLPSLAVALGLEPPRQADGRVLQTILDDPDAEWRSHVHYEWDFRFLFINESTPQWPFDRSLSSRNLAVSLGDETAYVHFGDGEYLAFDLAADPTWRTPLHDTDRLMEAQREMLTWRQSHTTRLYTDMLLRPERPGHWPTLVRPA